jgi:hypothetical protein
MLPSTLLRSSRDCNVKEQFQPINTGQCGVSWRRWCSWPPHSPFRAQSYSIDWFTIDGGGGTSTGVYSVSGTIGQQDERRQLHD